MRKFLFFCFSLAACGPAAWSQAALIEWSVTATVRAISTEDAVFHGLEIGSEISALYLVDDTSPVGLAGNGNIFFQPGVVGAVISAGTLDLSFNPNDSSFNFVLVNNGSTDHMSALASMNVNGAPTLNWALAGIELHDSSGQILDDILFPTLPELGELDAYGSTWSTRLLLQVSSGVGLVDIDAEITALSATDLSTVPLPGALLYLGGAVLALVGVRRRS